MPDCVEVPAVAVLYAVRYGLGRNTAANDTAATLAVQYADLIRASGWADGLLHDITAATQAQQHATRLARWDGTTRARWERAAAALSEQDPEHATHGERIDDSSVNAPTASAPWTVTLAWTPDQNFGRVSVMPRRAPVFAILGLLRAGEPAATVATEHGVTVQEVEVLRHLADDLEETT